MKTLTLVAAFAALVLAGCSSSGGSGAGKNLLTNGDFEQGKTGWFYIHEPAWSGFDISKRIAYNGSSSALLRLRADVPDTGSHIWGGIQELTTNRIPKRISGYYRVDHWEPATKHQYAQLVAILIGDAGKVPLEIRYVLTGIETAPFQLDNARYVFLGHGDPTQGKWIGFDRDLQQDFKKLWGEKAEGFNKIRVYFETRYDNKSPGTFGSADVYYDKLYLGD